MKHSSDAGQAIAELVICLPLLVLVFVALTHYGYIRHRLIVVQTAAYIGAMTAVSGRDGALAVTDYLKANGINVGKQTDIKVSKKPGIVNSWEASVTLSGHSSGILSKFFPEDYSLIRTSRIYTYKRYSLTNDRNWVSDGNHVDY